MANIWVSDGLEGCARSHQQAPVTYGILKDTQKTQEASECPYNIMYDSEKLARNLKSLQQGLFE